MSIASIHVLDVLIVGLVIAGVARGVVTGYMQQLLDVFAAAVALGCALVLMHPVSTAFGAFSKPLDEGRVLVVSFCLSFVFVYFFCFALLRTAVYTDEEEISISWPHRFVGGALGLLLTLTLLSTAFTALAQVNEPHSATRQQSVFYESVAGYMPAMWTATRTVAPIDPLPAYFERRQIEMPESAEDIH